MTPNVSGGAAFTNMCLCLESEKDVSLSFI